MSAARVDPMPQAELAAWRAARVAAGTPLPEGAADAPLEAVTLSVDDVQVGGALLQLGEEHGGLRCLVRVLQTTLPRDATEAWRAAIAALEAHAREQGAATLTTAVAPDLASVFGAAGFRATMTTVGKTLDPSSARELQDDRRVEVRPMTDAERHRFVADVVDQLRSGMARAGVIEGDSSQMGDLEARVAGLADDPPPTELLMTGTVAGVPVGRAWATLVETDGALDFLGNTIDLFPEHRGQRLTPSFLGALRRHVQQIGVRDVRLKVYAHDTGARQTFLDAGAGIEDVHLRKDLR